MSLLASLQLAKNSLFANQIGLQVTGNNIANANTPGYVKQRLELAPAPNLKLGNLVLGLGVSVTGITQAGDRFLDERLRNASSDVAFGEMQEKTYSQLEAIIGELNDGDLSTALSDFFNGINEVLNQPESESIRGFVTLEAEKIALRIRGIDERVKQVRTDLNKVAAGRAEELNQIIDEIALLNKGIVDVEGGGHSSSDAVTLRDRRTAALASLAKIIDVKVVEQPSGAVNVFTGGEYLIFGSEARHVVSVEKSDRGQTINELRLADTDRAIPSASGELAGIVSARDEILGGFLDQLDSMTQSLIHEFNKIHSGGQGLSGYDTLTSEFGVSDDSVALDQAGLTFTPQSGSLQVQIFDRQTGLTKSTDLFVQLDGLEDDTSLSSFVDSLNEIDGVDASITSNGKLKLDSEAANLEIAFGTDHSGLLAALGVNTFFSGTTSGTITVNSQILEDPTKFAGSKSGVGIDTTNAESLAALIESPLEALGNRSLTDAYIGTIGEVTENAAITRAVADGFRVFSGTLESENLAVTGVSLDEEAVNMLSYQRTFQASARLIATIDEMLQVLTSL